MSKKKVLGTSVAVIMGVGFLAGCGTSSSNQSGNTSNSSSSSSKPINLTVGIASSGPAETKMVKSQVKVFEQSNPNIHVKVTNFTGSEKKDLQTELAAHDAPDIFYVGSSIAEGLEDTGAIAPLGKYIKADNINLKNYTPSLLKAFQWKGKQYGMPKDSGSLALESNMKLLNKAGIQSPPKTWSQFETDAAKLKAKGIAPLAMPIDVARYYPFVLNGGGSYYNPSTNKVTFNQKANVSGLQFFLSNLKKGYIQTPKNLGGSWAGVPFAQGKVAMAAEGGWIVPFMQSTAPKMKYKVTTFPTQNGKRNNWVFTVAYEMSAHTKHPNAAAKLLFFMVGKKAETIEAKSGLAVPAYTPAQSVLFKKRPNYKPFAEGTKGGTPYQFGTHGPIFTNAINTATKAGYLKHLSASKVLQQAQKTYNSQK